MISGGKLLSVIYTISCSTDVWAIFRKTLWLADVFIFLLAICNFLWTGFYSLSAFIWILCHKFISYLYRSDILMISVAVQEDYSCGLVVASSLTSLRNT